MPKESEVLEDSEAIELSIHASKIIDTLARNIRVPTNKAALTDDLNRKDQYDNASERLSELLGLTQYAISVLSEIEQLEPMLFREFIAKERECPIWPNLSEAGCHKDHMPGSLKNLLFKSGLGTSPLAWPKGREDELGIQIKVALNAIHEFRQRPEKDRPFNYGMEPLFSDHGGDSELRNELLALPKSCRKKSEGTKYAKLILKMLFRFFETAPDGFLRRDAGFIVEDCVNDGFELFKFPKGKSKYYDKSPFAYSLFRNSINVLADNNRAEAIRTLKDEKAKRIYDANRQIEEQYLEGIKGYVPLDHVHRVDSGSNSVSRNRNSFEERFVAGDLTHDDKNKIDRLQQVRADQINDEFGGKIDQVTTGVLPDKDFRAKALETINNRLKGMLRIA